MPKKMHTTETPRQRYEQEKKERDFKKWINAAGRKFQRDFEANNTPLFDALMADRGRDRYGNDLPE